MTNDYKVLVTMNGQRWDKAPFNSADQVAIGAAVQTAIAWRERILREEPSAAVHIIIVEN